MARTKGVGDTTIVTSREEAAKVAKEKEKAKKPGEGFSVGKNNARAEEAARSKEDLEKTRELIDKAGIHTINLDYILQNRELLADLEGDGLRISNPNPNYNYGWFIKDDWQARKQDGYEFVSGNDQECREDAENFRPGWHDDETCEEDQLNERCRDLSRRQRGELTLMRIRLDAHYKVKVRDVLARAQQQQHIDNQFIEAAARAGYSVLPMNPKDVAYVRSRRGYSPEMQRVKVPRNPRELDRQLRNGSLGQ